MFLRLRNRLTYANVTSSIALFLALSAGTAYAANQFTGADIVDGSLNAADLANNSVTAAGQELANDTVTSAKIADGQVTGADVDEGSLGQVPNSYASTYTQFAYGVASNTIGADQLRQNSVWRYIGDEGQPAFQNGWHNYDQNPTHTEAGYQHAGFYKDQLGVIHLGGLVSGGQVGTLFHLPQGYCPWFFHAYPAIAGDAFARITVEWMTPGCDVILQFGSNAWVSLDGISWRDGYEEDTLTGKALREEMARRRALTKAGAIPELPTTP